LSQRISVETGYGWLPTPRASDGSGGGCVHRQRHHWNLKDWVKKNFGKGPMNPELSELAMDWPIGWTDLKPLEMGKFQQWQQQHGES
jgi:hypothetical protein